MNQQRPSYGNFTQFRNGPSIPRGGGVGTTMIGTNGTMGQQPPPLPPRIHRPVQSYQQPYMGGYGFGNSWNYRGLGGSGYGSYGGYGSYYPGIQSSGYASQQFGGPSGDAENRFIQFAEESSRPAFQSIESIVQTFSSVAMMLESTFFAMTGSFRAILSVAENVGRMRSMFGQLLGTFALVRLFKWLYRKVMYSLGFNPEDPSTEALWQKTAVEVLNGEKTGPSTWPILVFLSLLFFIPYMIHKLVGNIQKSKINDNNPKEWFKYNEPVYSAAVLYDFSAVSNEELNIKAGQKIWLAPQSLQSSNLPGWSKATDGTNVGFIPSNYIKIVGQLKKKTESNEMQSSLPTIQSVESTKDPNFNSVDLQMFQTSPQLSESVNETCEKPIDRNNDTNNPSTTNDTLP